MSGARRFEDRIAGICTMASTAVKTLSALQLTVLIKAFCLLSSVAIIVVRALPLTRERFLSYGARGQMTSRVRKEVQTSQKQGLIQFCEWLVDVTVPHSWFTHFYIFSTCMSLCWLMYFLFYSTSVPLPSILVPPQPIVTSPEASLLCMLLVLLQSLRRLRESAVFSHGSESSMWIGHYVFGLAFYFAVNIASWSEGAEALIRTSFSELDYIVLTRNPQIAFGVLLFCIASVAQHQAHTHLASLRKYSVPNHWMFKVLIAPHYTAECGIYLSLCMIAAPHQHICNPTLLWILLLTVVNLSVTADDTKQWMLTKFGERRAEIEMRYRIFPGVW